MLPSFIWAFLLLGVYLVFGLIAAYKFYQDKQIAIQNGELGGNQRRISERELLSWMCCFGCYGAAFSMQVFRHKTQKPLFNGLLAINLLGHTALVIYLLTVIF